MGNLANKLDRLEESLNCFYKGLKIQAEKFGPKHISLAVPLFKMGIIYYQYDKNILALEHLEKAKTIKQDYYQTDNHSSLAEIHTFIAKVNQSLKRKEAAIEHF